MATGASHFVQIFLGLYEAKCFAWLLVCVLCTVKNDKIPKTPPAAKTQDRIAYSVRETAEKLAVSTKTVYRFIDRGLLPTSKASRKLLISAKAVDNFVEVTA